MVCNRIVLKNVKNFYWCKNIDTVIFNLINIIYQTTGHPLKTVLLKYYKSKPKTLEFMSFSYEDILNYYYYYLLLQKLFYKYI